MMGVDGVFNVMVLCCLICRVQGKACESSGKCGAFGVCDSQGSPVCSCLQGFQPRNNQEWNSGNWSNGCVRRVPLSCGRADGFLKFPVIIPPAGSLERLYGPEDQCEATCFTNCSCLAYGFDGYGCGFWIQPVIVGIQKYPTASTVSLYIRFSDSELQLLRDQKKDSKKIIIVLVSIGFVIISTGTYFSWKWIAKHKAKKKALELANASASSTVQTSFQDVLSQFNIEDIPLFKLEILANATSNFSEANKLGEGGFGTVYKGALANGREIAVKRLSEASRQGIEEFMNEVGLITKLQHRNLVKLLGCCVENKEMMLIYEYMPNKSLDFFLFDPSQEILDWRKRFNIIEGICLGLLYLHRDSRLKIIHRDLKPSNVLLDNDWNPKISDFGMARIFGSKQDHVSTIRVMGTYGYMAPEYAMKGRFSKESDVFSLGVIMLEITTGRRNKEFHQGDCSNLLAHVWNLWNEDKVGDLVDPRISSLSNRADVMRCIHIGLLCVEEVPKNRPSILDVLSMLCSEIIELPEPKQPAFAMKLIRSNTGASSSKQSQRSSSSMNDVTLTIISGR